MFILLLRRMVLLFLQLILLTKGISLAYLQKIGILTLFPGPDVPLTCSGRGLGCEWRPAYHISKYFKGLEGFMHRHVNMWGPGGQDPLTPRLPTPWEGAWLKEGKGPLKLGVQGLSFLSLGWYCPVAFPVSLILLNIFPLCLFLSDISYFFLFIYLFTCLFVCFLLKEAL